MGMGECGWRRRRGRLPAAGGNGSSQPAGRPPGTLQSRFKETTGQVLPSLPAESDNSHQTSP